MGCTFGLPSEVTDVLARELAACATYEALAGEEEGDAEGDLVLVEACGRAAAAAHCRSALARGGTLRSLGALARRAARGLKTGARGGEGARAAESALAECVRAVLPFAEAAAGGAADASKTADALLEAGSVGTFVEALRASRQAGCGAQLRREALRLVAHFLRAARLAKALDTAGADAVLLDGLGWGATRRTCSPKEELELQVETVRLLAARPGALIGREGVTKVASALQWTAWSFAGSLDGDGASAGSTSIPSSTVADGADGEPCEHLCRMRDAVRGLMTPAADGANRGRITEAVSRVTSAAVVAVSLPPIAGAPEGVADMLTMRSVELQRAVVGLLREAARDTATGGATRAALRALSAWHVLLGPTCFAFRGCGAAAVPMAAALRQDVLDLFILACSGRADVTPEARALLSAAGTHAGEPRLACEVGGALREILDGAADGAAAALLTDDNVLERFGEVIEAQRASAASAATATATRGDVDSSERIVEAIVNDLVRNAVEGGMPARQATSAGDVGSDASDGQVRLSQQALRAVAMAARAVITGAGRAGMNAFAQAANEPALAAALVGCASEAETASWALPLLVDLLTAPARVKSEAEGREGLLRQLLEVLPRAQQRARNGSDAAKHLLMLLYSVRSALLANRSLLQPALCAVDGFVPVVSVLNEEYEADGAPDHIPSDGAEGASGGVASAISTAVLSTLVASLRESEASKATFERLVGYDTLESAVLRCHGGRPPRALLRGLLALACDDIGAGDYAVSASSLDGSASPAPPKTPLGTPKPRRTNNDTVRMPMVIVNEPALNLLLRVARRAPEALQSEALAAVDVLLQDSTANRLAAERAGLGSLLLEWLPHTPTEGSPSIRGRVTSLLCAAASGSFSARDARRAVSLLRPAAAPPPHAPALLEALTAMAERSKGPNAYFDMDGKRSGLQLPSGAHWPSSKGYAFATWLRLNEPPAGVAVMDVLRTPGKPAVADGIGYATGDLDGGLDERGLFSFASGEGGGCVVTLIRGGDLMLRTSGRRDDGAILTTGIGPGNWHHIVVSHSASRGPLAPPAVCKVYVDGTLVASTRLRYPRPPAGDGGVSAGGVGCGGAGGVIWKHADAAKGRGVSSEDSGVPPPWMGATPVNGQLGTVYLFADALSEMQVAALHMMGSSYRHTFSSIECGVVPVNLDSVRPALEGRDSLSSRVAACFVAASAEADGTACPNIIAGEGATSYHVRVMPGTQQRSTRGVRDAMHAIGGALVFAPLLSGTGPAAAACHADTVRLIASMLDGGSGAREAFHTADGVDILAHLLSLLPTELLTPALLRAVQQLERCCAGHKALRRTVARRCLLNYPLWWRAPEATRLQQLDIAASSPAAAFAEAGGVGALLDVAGEGTASALMRHAEARKAVVAAVTRAVTGAMASRRDEVSALPQREDLCACLAIALDTGSTSRPPPPADLAAGAMCGIASALLRPESRPTVLGVVGGFGGAVLAGAMMRPLPSRDGSVGGAGDVSAACGPVALAGLAFLVTIIQAVSEEINAARTHGTAVPVYAHEAIKGTGAHLSSGVGNIGARELITEATAVLVSGGKVEPSVLVAVASAMVPIRSQTAAVEAVLALVPKCSCRDSRAAALDMVAGWPLGDTLSQAKGWQEHLLEVLTAEGAGGADRMAAMRVFAAAHTGALSSVRGGWRVLERSLSCLHAAAGRIEGVDGFSIAHELLADALRGAMSALRDAAERVGQSPQPGLLVVDEMLHNAICAVALADELAMGDVHVMVECLTAADSLSPKAGAPGEGPSTPALHAMPSPSPSPPASAADGDIASEGDFELVDGEEAAAIAAAAHAPRPAGTTRLVSLHASGGGARRVPAAADEEALPSRGWEVYELACELLTLWQSVSSAARRAHAAAGQAGSSGSDLRSKAKGFMSDLFSSASDALSDATARVRGGSESKSKEPQREEPPHASSVALTGGAGAPPNATGEGLAGAVLRLVVLCAVCGPQDSAAAAALRVLRDGGGNSPLRVPRGADARALRRRADRAALALNVLEEATGRMTTAEYAPRKAALERSIALLRDVVAPLLAEAMALERGGGNDGETAGSNQNSALALPAECRRAWTRRGLAAEARALFLAAKGRREAAALASKEWVAAGQRMQRAYEAIASARAESVSAVLAGDAERRAAAAAARDEAVGDGAIRWRELQREAYRERGPWEDEGLGSSGGDSRFEWRMDKVEDASRRRLRLKLTTALAAEGARGCNKSPRPQAQPQTGQPEEDVVNKGGEFAANCSLVTAKRVIRGRLRLDVRAGDLVFRPYADAAEVASAPWCRTRRWALTSLAEVRTMRYKLRHCAFELALVDRRTAFFAFATKATARAAAERVAKARPGAALTVTDRRRAKEAAERVCARWRAHQMSTFDFLMALNTLAGRTFNDLTQYPVFPWVLADYESEELDLSDPTSYRDLSKPVGALNSKQLEFVKERYGSFEDPEGVVPKFHYGSHYSSAGAVLYYMIRLQPFHWLHRELQGGKLDHADRLFHSVGATWGNVLHNTSDVKELTPEWFYQPETFRNLGGYELGTRQDGTTLGDVVLPRWARGSPEEFVRLHREALESEHVSAHLHQWVDLIFGYKQTGKAAVDACNVFYYLTYEGAVDVDAIDDERERASIEAQIVEFGQTPAQLFRRPCAERGGARPLRRPLRDAPQLLEPAGVARPLGEGIAGGAVQHVVLSPDGRALALSEGGTLATHRWITPATLAAGAFSFAGGQAAAVAGGGARCALEPDAVPPRHLGHALALAPHASACFAAPQSLRYVLCGGSWDNSVRAVSTDSGRLLQACVAHKDIVTSLALSADGATLASGSADTTVMLWDATPQPERDVLPLAGAPRAVLRGHQDAVVALAVDADLDLVVSGGADGCTILHALRSGQYLRALAPPGASPGAASLLVIAPGVLPCVVVYTAGDLSVRSYTFNGRLLARGDARERLHALSVCAEGDVLVAGGDRGVVCVRRTHDLVTTRTLRPPSAAAGAAITALTVSREEAVVCATAAGAVAALALGQRAAAAAAVAAAPSGGSSGSSGSKPATAARRAAAGLPGADLLGELLNV